MSSIFESYQIPPKLMFVELVVNTENSFFELNTHHITMAALLRAELDRLLAERLLLHTAAGK